VDRLYIGLVKVLIIGMYSILKIKINLLSPSNAVITQSVQAYA